MTKDTTPDGPQPTPDETAPLPVTDATTELPPSEADRAAEELRAPDAPADEAHSAGEDPAAGEVPATVHAAPAAVHAAPAAIPPIPPAAPGGGSGSGVRDTWRRVWGSGWGKLAVALAAAAAVLAVVAAIGLGAFVAGRGPDRFGDRMGWSACDEGPGPVGPGQMRRDHDGKGPMSMGRGHQRGQDCPAMPDDDEQWGPNRRGPNTMGPNGMGAPRSEGAGPNGMGPNGMGEGMGPGMMDDLGPAQGPLGSLPGTALGNALHGELVLGGTTLRTVLFQVGEVTEFTPGGALTVRSTDGFTATYTVTAQTQGPATAIPTGTSVRVIADKDGAKATRIQVLGSNATS